jgi:hypothetical protein
MNVITLKELYETIKTLDMDNVGGHALFGKHYSSTIPFTGYPNNYKTLNSDKLFGRNLGLETVIFKKNGVEIRGWKIKTDNVIIVQYLDEEKE